MTSLHHYKAWSDIRKKNVTDVENLITINNSKTYNKT